MKKIKALSLVLGCWLGLVAMAAAQTPVTQDETQPNPSPGAAQNSQEVLPSPGGQATPAQAPAPGEPSALPPSGSSDGLIRLNFRGVPLDMVLNHLSEAAGFIILAETELKGNVDVWSNQPLNKEEALDLLGTILFQNGYAAIRNGRMLRIVTLDAAKKLNIPVNKGSDPELIPNSDEMVTQVIPVRYANAVQLTRDLQPLLDTTYATLTANESGNALVLTDTQSNIRRMASIVAALDTSISSISTIRVFPLRYADAKELATAVKELFTPPESNNNNDRRRRFERGFGRGGFGGDSRGGGGDGGGPQGQQETGDSAARSAASHVVAVADERANNLIVAAPDEFISSIEQLVKEVDVQVNDVTELKVFRLENADPLELAAIFLELFPDETNQEGGSREFRFGGFGRGGDRGGRGGGRNGGGNTETSERMKKQGQVHAVADPRTSSLIVSAAKELMPEIEQMVAQLDSSSSKKQQVYVFPLENADVVQVEQILKNMFDRGGLQGNRNNTSANQNSALGNRRQNQQTTGSGGGLNNSGLGGGLGGGGQGGGRTGQNFP